MEPGFMSVDLSDLSLDDLFQPPTYNAGASDLDPVSIDLSSSVGLGLKDEMENYQDLCPSLVLSPGPWRPPDEGPDPLKILMIQEEEESVPKTKASDTVTSSPSWWNVDGTSQAGKGRGILMDAGFSWMQSGGTEQVQMDDDWAKVNGRPDEAKVKKKPKVITTSKTVKNASVAKVGSRGGGSGRRVTTGSAAGPAASSSCSSKEEERKRKRQESNRRAAERYRTKLKASANDVATEHHRLMQENERLRQETVVHRRHLSLLISSIKRHQQFCSVPFLLPEQFHLQAFHSADASTSQICFNSAEPFHAEFQLSSNSGSEITAELSIQDCCSLKQNGSSPPDARCHDDHGQYQISPFPFLVAGPLRQDPFQELQNNSFGQLRVIGLYAKSPI